MSRKLLGNNITEIKFSSPDEQEWSLLDLSMIGGDSNALRYQTASSQNTVALWFEENDAYEPDFFAESNWSEATGRTVSSCSWGDDEFERESTIKVQALLDAVDEAIYDGKNQNENNQNILDEEILEECQEWATKYPYLRLKGHTVDPLINCETVPCQINFDTCSLPSTETVSSSHQGNGNGGLVAGDEQCVQLNNGEEEIYAQEGIYKESMDAVSICKGTSGGESSPAISKINPSVLNNLKESVVERLVSQLWPEVLSLIRENSGKTSAFKHDVCLPPITAASDSRTPMSHLGNEERSRHDSPDFPSLDGILTVSSKVLQKRRETFKASSEIGIKNSMETDTRLRPGTSEVVSSSYERSSFFFSSEPIESFAQQRSKNLKLNQLKTDLAPHEEEYHSLPDILRGIHIEPEAKDSLCKCRTNENTQLTPRPMSFLPPIDDCDNFSSPQQDLFIESPIAYQMNKFEYNSLERNSRRSVTRPNTSTKNQRHSRSPSLLETNKVEFHIGKTSSNQSGSRPNTGMTSRSIPDIVTRRKKSAVNDRFSQFNGFRPKLSVPPSPSQRIVLSQQRGVNKHGPNVWSSEKPVTLFPLVTSLEPDYYSNQKGKNQQNIKKGGPFALNRSKR